MWARIAARLQRVFLTPPRPRDWLECALAALVIALVVAPIGLHTALIAMRPRPAFEIARIAAIAFFAPSLFEEAVFRGALIPGRDEPQPFWPAFAFATVLFVLWHLLEAALFGARAQVFLRPDFLFAAALIGLACGALRRRSGSIWPAIVLHWLAAAIWLGCLGGPALDEL